MKPEKEKDIYEEEPEIDESLLTPEQKRELEKPFFRKKYLLIWGILVAAIIACIVVVCVLR